MNPDISITNRVGSLLYLWGSALNTDDTRMAELGLEHQVLFESSPTTWVIPFGGTPLMPTDITPQGHDIIGPRPLALKVTGQFPNAYANTPPPAWPSQGDTAVAAVTEVEQITEAPGQLLLYGCGEMFSDQIIGAAGNALLMLNSVDALVLGDDLINVRTKLMTQRFISETSAAAKMFWRFFVIILIPAILITIGVARYMMRRKRREIYQRLVEQAG